MVEQIAEDYPDRFAALTMHVNADGYDLPWGQHRLDVFYGIPGVTPTFMVNALWNAQPDDYRYYVELEMARSADMTLDLTGNHVSGNTWDISARACLEGGGDRMVRVYIAPTLDNHPDLARYTTNLLMQKPAEFDVTIPGGGCRDVTATITFDPVSAGQTSDIVIIGWAQAATPGAPTDVQQAAIMRWPFPAGSQLTTIEVTPTEAQLGIGEELTFTAVGKDQSGTVVPLADPEWSLGAGSGGGVFTSVDGDTVTFTATTAGTRQILCTDAGVTGGAVVTITEAPRLAAIEIDPASASVEVGGTIAFTASGLDQYGDEFPLADPVWSAAGAGDGSFDPETGVTTVFTGAYPGEVVISCTQGDVAATAQVEVTGDAPQLAVITVAPERAQLRVGQALELVASGVDQYGRSVELGDPAWRLEGDGDGTFEPGSGAASTTFTATAPGSVEVICAADGIEGTAEVEIAAAGLPAPRRAGRRVAP